MTGTAAILPKHKFTSATGIPLANGTLTTYLAGTTTLSGTWQDSDLSTANTNPIELDAAGECTLWLDRTKYYKMVLKNSAGVIQWTQDNIAGWGSLSSDAGLIGYTPAGVGAVDTTVQAKLRESVSVKDFGAVGDGVTNDSAAIQLAINAINTAGGGVVKFPLGYYNLGTTGLTIYSNVVLLGDVSRYAGTSTRGVSLIYSGVGNVIFGQNIVDVQLLNLDVNMTSATGTSLKAIYLNGCWKSSIKNITVRGMTVAKGYSILIDTNAGVWGAQHNYLEQVECADGIIRLAGTSNVDGVTTTAFNTIRGYMYQFAYSQVTLVNSTAEEWPNGQYAYSFTGDGCYATMLGCDIENSSATATAIYIDANAKVKEFGTVWAGFNGTGANRVTGLTDALRSYGGEYEYINNGMTAGAAVKVVSLLDSNTDYLNEYLYPTSVSGGAQSGYKYWTRRSAGTVYTDHDWEQHAYIKKAISTSALTAVTIATIPVANGTGLKLSAHAQGIQTGDNYYSNSRGCNVLNNGGTLTIVQDTQVSCGSTGAISFIASGGDLLVKWTPTTTNASSGTMTVDIRGPWVSYT